MGGSWCPGLNHKGFGNVYYDRVNDSKIKVIKEGLKFLYPKIFLIKKIIIINTGGPGLSIKPAYELAILGLEKKMVLYSREHIYPKLFGINHNDMCKCIAYKNIFEWSINIGGSKNESLCIIICSNGSVATMINNNNIDFDKLIYTGMKSSDGNTWLAIKKIKKKNI
jgi:hypothetical protein